MTGAAGGVVLAGGRETCRKDLKSGWTSGESRVTFAVGEHYLCPGVRYAVERFV